MKNLAVIVSTFQSAFALTTPLAMTDYSASSFHSGQQNNSYQNSGTQFKKFKRNFKKSPFILLAIVVVIIIVGVVGINSLHKQQAVAGAQATNTGTTQQVAAPKPTATETLNKNFAFPLKDASGKVVSNIQYEIQSVELDNEVIIKGQEATAVQGKTFLVLNLKITNTYDKAIQLNTRDYVRLIVDGDTNEKLAASIHNDPVDVEPIATTFTRVGFPISTDAKNLILEIGQIDGPKQTVQLNLK